MQKIIDVQIGQEPKRDLDVNQLKYNAIFIIMMKIKNDGY